MNLTHTHRIAFFLISITLLSFSAYANKTRKTDIIVKAGINGQLYYGMGFNNELSKQIKYNKLGFGNTFQVGYNTRKTELTEYRHYIEFNHIHFSADIEHLGSFNADKVFISISPFQYYVKLNPEAANVISLEAGLTLGFNLYSKYNYTFLEEKRTRTVMNDETGISGINVGVNCTRNHFNKEVEIGLKMRISPLLGVLIADHNYLATEIFYGIKF